MSPAGVEEAETPPGLHLHPIEAIMHAEMAFRVDIEIFQPLHARMIANCQLSSAFFSESKSHLSLKVDVHLSMLANHLRLADGDEMAKVLLESVIVIEQTDRGKPLAVVKLL